MQHRRHEKPIARTNPSGRKVWVARWTDRRGKRSSAGTFDLKGPCRDAQLEGRCCAQHRIDFMYETDTGRGRAHTGTLGEYAATWTRRHPRSDRTNRTNEHRLSRVLAVKVEDVPLRDWPLAELRRRHATELMDYLLVEQGRAIEGARGIMRTLSALMQDAIDDELCEANPFRNLKVRANDPRVRKAPRVARVQTWESMRRLAAAGGEYEPMLRVLSDCGLRLGEVLGLHRVDLKLGEVCDEYDCPFARAEGPRGPHLHVRRTADQGVVREGTKRERLRQVLEGGRVVPVPAGLAVLLRAMPRRIDAFVLFPTPRGLVWWADNFRQDVWEPARRASKVDASPHDFRHSWISLLRAEGVDPEDLAAMAGHSVMTATSIYTHSLGRSYEQVARAVGQ